MKTFLSFAITLLCASEAWAANPSFQSFFTNDFIVAQPLIYAKHTNTGGTNVFVNTTIVYTNVTNLIENSFITITNSYVTNTFTTNFFDNSVIVVTNTTVENSFLTITNTTLNQTFVTNFFDNSVIIITNTSVTINGTNVPTINPTIGRLPYKSGTNSFDDSAMFFIDTNTVGAVEVDANIVGVTNLVTGGFVISVDSGDGYGILTNAPFVDLLLWTNNGTSYQPTQPQGSLVARGIESYDHLSALGSFITQLSAFEFLIAGENDIDVSNESYVAVVGSDSIATNSWLRISSGNGIGQHLFIVNSAINSGFQLLNGDPCWDNPSLYVALKGGDWNTDTYGDTIELLGTFNGWAEVGRFWDNTNNVSAMDLWTNNLGALQPVALTNYLYWTNSVVLGPGGTNSILRRGKNFIYTNSANDAVFFKVINGLGIEGGFGVAAGNHTWITADSGQRVYFAPDYTGVPGGSYYMTTAAFTPVVDNNVDIGSYGQAFRDGSFRRNLKVYGFQSDTNYTSLAISHTGTNGSIVLDSQSSGTAGDARKFLFETNGIPILEMYGTRLNVTNSGNYVGLYLQAGSSPHIGGSSVISLDNTIVTKAIVPDAGNTYDLGTTASNGSYKDTYIQGTHYIQGMQDGAGNYSRLAVSHTGTNGSIILDTQAAGTAGAARSFLIQSNGTSFLQINSAGSVALLSPTDPGSPFSSKRISLFTSIAATASTPYNSPSVLWSGNGWATNLAASDSIQFAAFNVASNGASAASGRLTFKKSNATNSFNVLEICSDGPIKLSRGITKAQKALITPEEGMMVWQTDNTPGLRLYQSGAWVMVSTVADP